MRCLVTCERSTVCKFHTMLNTRLFGAYGFAYGPWSVIATFCGTFIGQFETPGQSEYRMSYSNDCSIQRPFPPKKLKGARSLIRTTVPKSLASKPLISGSISDQRDLRPIRFRKSEIRNRYYLWEHFRF